MALTETTKSLINSIQFGDHWSTRERRESNPQLHSRSLKSVSKAVSSLIAKGLLQVRPLVDPSALGKYEVSTFLHLESSHDAYTLEQIILAHPTVLECSLLDSNFTASVLFRISSNAEVSQFFSYLTLNGIRVSSRRASVVHEKWLYTRSFLNQRAERESVKVYAESDSIKRGTLRDDVLHFLDALLPSNETTQLGICRLTGVSRRVLPRLMRELRVAKAIRGWAYELNAVRCGCISREITLALNNPCEATKEALRKYASLSRYITELRFATGYYDAHLTIETDERCYFDEVEADLHKVLGENLRELTNSPRSTRSFRTLELSAQLQEGFKEAA